MKPNYFKPVSYTHLDVYKRQELYQKKSPKEAMDYFLDLSRAFDLFTVQQSFDERKPFIRLNLSGKSYGLAYANEELACVFAEHPAEDITSSILFEIAEIFPHCLVFETDGKICLQEAEPEVVTQTEALSALTDLMTLEAVSYTHLDVYKRQLNCRPISLRFRI